MNRAQEHLRQPTGAGASIISFIEPIRTIFLSVEEGQFKYFVFLYDGRRAMTLGSGEKGTEGSEGQHDARRAGHDQQRRRNA